MISNEPMGGSLEAGSGSPESVRQGSPRRALLQDQPQAAPTQHATESLPDAEDALESKAHEDGCEPFGGAAPVNGAAFGATGGRHDGLDVRAVWQITSMSLGIGVFAIPCVFLKLGWAQGMFWVLTCGMLANFAMQRLLDIAAMHRIETYEGLAEQAFGFAGKLVMVMLTFCTSFIGSLSFVSAARDLLANVAVAFLLDIDINSPPNGVQVLSKLKSAVTMTVLVAAVLPLCLGSTVGGAWLSKGCVLTMTSASLFFIGTCVATFVRSCESLGVQCGEAPHVVAGSAADAFQYVATLAFSFSMVFAVFPVLGERVVDGDVGTAVARTKPAVTLSVVICCVVYGVVGLVGVFTFGTVTKPVALSNFALSQPPSQAITFIVGVCSALLVAVVAFPTVNSLELFAGLVCLSRGCSCSRARSLTSAPTSLGIRPVVVLIIGVAFVAVDLGLPTNTAFALTGSLGLAVSAYVMPCVLFLKLGWRASAAGVDGLDGGAWVRAGTPVVVLFGAALLFGSTPVTLWRLVEGEGGLPPEPLEKLLCHQQAL